MFAIFKREFKAYFLTPIGYVYMGFFLLLTGIFFFFDNILSQRSHYTDFLGGLLLVFLLVTPLLTMRLFSEERKQKTDQLLLTSPVSITGLVCGKFFAALLVYCATLLVTVAYPVLIAVHGDLEAWETLGSYVGFIFLGACYISVGLFISATTENQFIAGVTTFFVLFFIWLVDPISQTIPSDTRTGIISAGVILAAVLVFIFLNTRNWVIVLAAALLGAMIIGGLYLFQRGMFFGFVQRVLGWISLNQRYRPFTMGLFRFDALLYYISFSGLFLFLTVRLIEKRRWN